MPALSRQQVREIDRYAIDVLKIPGLILMENAGRQAADAAGRMLRASEATTCAIVAGAGNNGGDGYVIARHLALRGVSTVTFIVAPREKISGDALANLEILETIGSDVRFVSPEAVARLAGELRRCDLIVDAVGGTGIRGVLTGQIAEAVEQINACGRAVLSVDIPTGLDCDEGTATGPAVRAKTTVTFAARKKGFENPSAAEFTGEVIVADIGIPAEYVAALAAPE